MKKYRVWLKSKPGFYAQYSGKVDVLAVDESEAQKAALRKLKSGTFFDRNDSMWAIEKIECVGVA